DHHPVDVRRWRNVQWTDAATDLLDVDRVGAAAGQDAPLHLGRQRVQPHRVLCGSLVFGWGGQRLRVGEGRDRREGDEQEDEGAHGPFDPGPPEPRCKECARPYRRGGRAAASARAASSRRRAEATRVPRNSARIASWRIVKPGGCAFSPEQPMRSWVVRTNETDQWLPSIAPRS